MLCCGTFLVMKECRCFSPRCCSAAHAGRVHAIDRGPVVVERGAVGLHEVPMRAELIESLTAGVARVVVAGVVVQRVTVIGELGAAVASGGAADLIIQSGSGCGREVGRGG